MLGGGEGRDWVRALEGDFGTNRLRNFVNYHIRLRLVTSARLNTINCRLSRVSTDLETQ